MAKEFETDIETDISNNEIDTNSGAKDKFVPKTSFLGKYARHRSINGKLMFMSLMVSGVTLIISFTGFISYDVWNTRRTLVREVVELGDLIASRAEPLISFFESSSGWSNDAAKKSATDHLKVIRNRPDVLSACMFNARGQLITQYNTSDDNFMCPVVKEKQAYFKGRRLHVYRDIKDNRGEQIGSLYLISDTRFIEEHIRVFGIGITLFALIVACIAFMIVQSLRHLIIDPIQALTRTAEKVMGNRDYDVRAQLFYSDEIGVLARAFNNMLQQVQLRDMALMEANESLETKVKTRTAELQTRNEEIQKRNEELERTRNQLVKALEVKDAFMANMSHEIRTPIHGVQNFVDFLVRDWDMFDDDQRRDMAKRAQDASGRLLTLINNLLDLAKLENHTMMFSIKPCNIDEPLQQVVREMDALCMKKSVKIVADNQLKQDAKIECDSARIAQVFSNLIGNAIKFAPKESTITIRIEEYQLEVEGEDREAIKCSIIDQGMGVPEEELEAIFERFAESSRTRTQAGGTGLGLSICRYIISAHHGTIWAENAPDGSGAAFIFVLPKGHVAKEQDKASMSNIVSAEIVESDITDEEDQEALRRYEAFLESEEKKDE